MIDPNSDFGTFVATRFEALHRFAFLLCGDWQYAEDIVQNALMRTYDAANRRPIVDLEAYSRTVIARGYATSMRRKWKYEIPTAQLPEPSHARNAIDECDDGRHVLELLGTLPATQRVILAFRYIFDLKDEDIAVMTNLNVGTVKSRAARALAALRPSEAFAGVRFGEQP